MNEKDTDHSPDDAGFTDDEVPVGPDRNDEPNKRASGPTPAVAEPLTPEMERLARLVRQYVGLAGRGKDEQMVLDALQDALDAARAAAPPAGPSIDEQVETIERVLQPRGRCQVCGGGEFYWKHMSDSDEYHAFIPPASPEPTPGLREADWSDELALIIAKARFGPGVDMGGKHNPRPSEYAAARQFVADFRAALATSPAPEPTGLDAERLRKAMDVVVPESIPPLYWTNERLAVAIAAEYARLAEDARHD